MKLYFGTFLLLSLLLQSCTPVTFSLEPVSQQAIAFREVLSKGLVTNNIACVMCHTNVHGDMSGFGSMTFRNDSHGTIIGNIFAADIKLQRFIVTADNRVVLDPAFVDTLTDVNLLEQVLPELANENIAVQNGKKVVKPGEKHNVFESISFASGGDFFTMTDNDPAKREIAEKRLITNPFSGRPIIHEADFPSLDPELCKDKATGSITTADGKIFKSPIVGHQIFVKGKNVPTNMVTAQLRNEYDTSCPASETLSIDGEIIIQGDLVISGCIQGQGTIYTNGNVYIPNDIKLKNSAFPFTRTIDEAVLKAESKQKSSADMVSFGAAGFVMIGNIKPEVLSHEEQDPHFRNGVAIYSNLYNWIGGGTRTENENIYRNYLLKKPFGLSAASGAVALIEANIYSNLGIAATLTSGNRSNIVVNGSMASPHLSLLAGGYNAGAPANAINPFNQIPFHTTELNQDFRLKYLNKGYECQRAR